MKFERLADKITQVRGIAFNPKDISEIPLPDYIPVLKANNIKERGIDFSNLIYIHRSKVKPEQFIKKGDLLLAASSGSKDIVGKNIFFENDFEGSFGAFCKLVRPNKKVNHNFLAVFFKTPIFKRHIRKLIQGALINNLKNEHIDSLQIPSLSFSTQIQIANILSKAETLIEQRKQSIVLLDEFLKSMFLEMFGDPAFNKKQWCKFQLQDLIASGDKINYGVVQPGEDGNKTGIEIIRVGDFDGIKINSKNLKLIDVAIEQKHKASRLSGDEVLLACVGATIGKIALTDKSHKGFNIVRAVARVRCNSGKLNRLYLCQLLLTSYYQFNLKNLARTVAQPTLNIKQIEELKIPVPPLELQNQFAAIVTKTEALKEQYKISLQELENLYGSLSQKAFKGELIFKDAEEALLLMAAEPDVEYN